MSERRYTVTEGQLLSIIKEAWVNGVQEGETGESELSIAQMLEDRKATLTPDPEPSGEVVERAKTWLQWRYEEHCRGDDKFVRLADAQALLTAEVTRQVEERTRGYREALENAQSFLDGIMDDLQNQRTADWYPEGAHSAATSMSESMRLIAGSIADYCGDSKSPRQQRSI